MADKRSFFENLVYQTVDRRRFTQQSPVMPDVWIQYAMNPGLQQHLLMIPNWHYTPANLSVGIKKRLRADRDRRPELDTFRRPRKKVGPPAVAHNQNAVVATLWFDELVRAVLPLSSWWKYSISGIHDREDKDGLVALLSGETRRLEGALATAWDDDQGASDLGPDLLWLTRVVGLIAYLATEDGRAMLGRKSEDRQVGLLQDLLGGTKRTLLTSAFVALLRDIEPVFFGADHPLYSVNLNRVTSPTLRDSVAAVKADASSRVFQVDGAGIRWAVIDSGIDATHVALRKRNADGVPRLQPFGRPRRRRRVGPQSSHFTNDTRVVATYDFVHIRELLGAEPHEVDQLPMEWFPVLEHEDMRSELSRLLEDADSGTIDWHRLRPFLEIPHTPSRYRAPVHRHGTHVAGIIGADWRVADEDHGLNGPREDLSGICPAIEFYDLRVLDEDGTGNEFAIMSAMQFVRTLNHQKAFVAIHGVNLSLSIPHDVANYACGRTPVCEEAERLVGSGVVVVAAAGNSGRARYLTPSNEIDDGFRTVSITDPGNAASVITVGATHRRDAHTYGVSYFSSRGPTGDGRLKPDLVAPGEKIRSTVPGDADDRLDGTSMAAPHVSGAAALIMARHAELIGQPQRIKRTLCETATDLGREPYFQGAGLLDILRALQSI